MKKTGLLNQPISAVIAGLGHQDRLCIADAGLPIPSETQRIDLSVTANIPRFLDVLDGILGEMQIEAAIIAEELEDISPEMFQALVARLGDIPIEKISHVAFKEATKSTQAVIRSGEFTPYANIILIAGVIF